MPIGLYTSYEVTAPCGLLQRGRHHRSARRAGQLSRSGRMKAGLLWFTRGYVEYQFPNNAKLTNTDLDAIVFSLELSSEVPGTSADWPSDITLTVNGVDVGTWTSPGDFGDKRGVFTPDWWKLKGSQYGKLKELAHRPERHLCRRREDLGSLARRSQHRRPPLDPPAHRRA